MFIDIHAHAYRFPQKFVCGFCSAEQLVKRFDELGIAKGVVPKLMRKYPNLYGDLSDGTPFLMLSRDPEYGANFLTEFQDRLYFGSDIMAPIMEVPIIAMLNEWRDTGRILQEVYDKIAYKNAEKMKEFVKAEKELALLAYEIMCRNSTVGYEAANHYYVTRASLMEKIVNCDYLLDAGL
ncbi:MAG: hypothetical protein IJE62_00810 [Clostridia bacterium]|nr:hypothetical protein [Clostridia bacterium]